MLDSAHVAVQSTNHWPLGSACEVFPSILAKPGPPCGPALHRNPGKEKHPLGQTSGQLKWSPFVMSCAILSAKLIIEDVFIWPSNPSHMSQENTTLALPWSKADSIDQFFQLCFPMLLDVPYVFPVVYVHWWFFSRYSESLADRGLVRCIFYVGLFNTFLRSMFCHLSLEKYLVHSLIIVNRC